jgi:hypothetical protein
MARVGAAGVGRSQEGARPPEEPLHQGAKEQRADQQQPYDRALCIAASRRLPIGLELRRRDKLGPDESLNTALNAP